MDSEETWKKAYKTWAWLSTPKRLNTMTSTIANPSLKSSSPTTTTNFFPLASSTFPSPLSCTALSGQMLISGLILQRNAFQNALSLCQLGVTDFGKIPPNPHLKILHAFPVYSPVSDLTRSPIWGALCHQTGKWGEHQDAPLAPGRLASVFHSPVVVEKMEDIMTTQTTRVQLLASACLISSNIHPTTLVLTTMP